MKYLPPIIIGVALLTGGAFFLSNNMNNKPIVQSHRGYDIEVTRKPNADQITLSQPSTIKYKIKNDRGEIVKDFAIAHEKIMHFITVRKDLMYFQHLHPAFNKENGEFIVNVIFTVDGPYRFFADFTPGKDNPMKLPVTVYSDLTVGDVSNFQPNAAIPNTDKEMTVLPDYKVTYTLPAELKSQTLTTYSLTIEKNNQPVKLEKYLGALGHSVVLKEKTLDYIHTHAGEQTNTTRQMEHKEHSMEMTQQENRVDFTTTFPEQGIYKIFTQFQDQGKVFTTEYAVEAK